MKLFYRTFGEGPPIIILHGLFGMSDNWNTISKKLAESYTVIVPDLRNHGSSPHSELWDYDSMAEDVLELMNDLHLTRTSIIGHSMGGKVAMNFSLNYPDRVIDLFIVDIAPKKYSRSDFNHKLIQSLLSISPITNKSRKEIEQYLEDDGFDFSTAQLILKNVFWKENKLAWRFNIDVLAKNIDLAGEAIKNSDRTFSGKAFFIRGEKSNYILDSDLIEIKKIFPAAELITIADAGHWVHADRPEQFVNVIITLMNKKMDNQQ